MAGRAAGSETAAAYDPAAFAAAHKAVMADPSIQFALPAEVPSPPPQWLVDFGHWLGHVLRPIGRALAWLFGWLPDWPWAKILLWGVLAVAAAAVLWALALRLQGQSWRWPWRRGPKAEGQAEEAEWRPDAGPARALLAEADALADQGRYEEAAHLLLWRSIEDIDRRRPELVRPALTSRDIAAATALPETPRAIFTRIAQAVERSLFGGRSLGADEWGACRTAYAEFALPKAWQ